MYQGQLFVNHSISHFSKTWTMQNIHLINSYNIPVREFSNPSSNLPPLTSLTGLNAKLLFPNIPESTVSVCFSDFLNHYIVFTEDEVFVEGETEAYFTFPFLINYAVLSKSGDFALVQTSSDLYSFDLDPDSPTRLEKVAENLPGPIHKASFRYDNKFIAVIYQNVIQTFSKEIRDQQGTFNAEENITAVSWNPLGSWIAITAGNKVIFLEKNCKLRQTIELDNPLLSVVWSPHRDIIAVMDSNYKVTVLSMKNRVFNRKFVLNSPAPQLIPTIFWGREYLTLVTINPQNGNAFVYDINHSVDKDERSIYVVNGNLLQVSDWSRALIPPPLSNRKLEFDSQITAMTSNNKEIAVFTLNHLHIVNLDNTNERKTLDISQPAQCATYINGILHFASNDKIYTVSNGEISLLNQLSEFCSFISPSFYVTSMATIVSSSSNQTKTVDDITEFIENNNEYVAFCRNGKIIRNDNLIAENVISVLFEEKLFAYIYIGNNGTMCHIQYGIEQANDRQIEPLAQLLFFAKHIYSIVTLMNRGNIETNSPHVIVEAALRSLISEHQYSEGLRISKKYQIPFSKFIHLGEIDLPDLCNQIPDSQLRSCLSVLSPLNSKNDMKFVLNFLSFILGNEVTYDIHKKQVNVPDVDHSRKEPAAFITSCLICFILLESPVTAVQFSCSFQSSDEVKQGVTFLLTLYDNNQLYDISLKTYNTNCIASVALLTMKEPSSYVAFIEDLDKCTNQNLKMAKIDEAASDPESAVRHYAAAGPEYEEIVRQIIINESRDSLSDSSNKDDQFRLYNAGIDSYETGSEPWLQIIKMKLDALTKVAKKERDNDAIARTAIQSRNPELIVQFIKEIVKGKQFPLAIPCLGPEHYHQVKKALEEDRQFHEAAQFTAQYLPEEKAEAARLFISSHEWYSAIQNGADIKTVALDGYKTLISEAHRKRDSASNLKSKFVEVVEKQKAHPDSSIRHGKNKDKRGLPAIVSQLMTMLPDEKKDQEFKQVEDLLRMIGEHEKCEELRVAYREMSRSIWPIPKLPENEELPIPIFLRGIV